MRTTLAPHIVDAYIREFAPTHVGHGWILDGGTETLECKCGSTIGLFSLTLRPIGDFSKGHGHYRAEDFS